MAAGMWARKAGLFFGLKTWLGLGWVCYRAVAQQLVKLCSPVPRAAKFDLKLSDFTQFDVCLRLRGRDCDCCIFIRLLQLYRRNSYFSQISIQLTLILLTSMK